MDPQARPGHQQNEILSVKQHYIHHVIHTTSPRPIVFPAIQTYSDSHPGNEKQSCLCVIAGPTKVKSSVIFTSDAQNPAKPANGQLQLIQLCGGPKL